MKIHVERLRKIAEAYKNALEYDYSQEEFESDGLSGMRPDELANEMVREIGKLPDLI
ncbi:MAG: hypothetical protein KAS32_27235 [Candidatus Peribacteraceae bacterium]|nr:hypothetical protein [Candidatus Peribacteraceae bacterium]